MTTKIDWRIVIGAIVGLTAIEICALLKGVDGTLMTIIVAVIAGLAGWTLPAPKIQTK